MANANDSGDEEEERETNTGNQDNSYRLKVIGTKRRNCKYMYMCACSLYKIEDSLSFHFLIHVILSV